MHSRIAAIPLAAALLVGSASTVLADYAQPTFIQIDARGMRVTVSGTWEWPTRADCDPTNRYTGWAVDWDDPADPGNPVGDNGIGVGTADDNMVHTDGGCGAVTGGVLQGTFSEVSHVYSAPGTYHVCVVLYDVHAGEEDLPARHNRIAGGPNRNTDNSVENNGGKPIDCPAVQVTVPGPNQASSAPGGATAGPSGGQAGPPGSGGPAAEGGAGTSGGDGAPASQTLPDAMFNGPGFAIVLVPLIAVLLLGISVLLVGARRRRGRRVGPQRSNMVAARELRGGSTQGAPRH
jgi:hypothetical protein